MTVLTKARYSTDADFALRTIAKSGRVCLDLETQGLDPHAGNIGLVIMESGGELFMLREPPDWLPLVFQDPDTEVLIYNARFDLQWLFKKFGIFHPRNLRCLYLEELLVSTQRRGVKHTLDAALQRRLGVEIDKGLVNHEETDWCGSLTPEMEEYALGDIIYMADLGDELGRLLKQTQQERAAQVENEAVAAVAAMSLNGLGVDRAAWTAAVTDPGGWVDKAEAAKAYLNTLANTEAINWNSHVQIRNVVKDLYGVQLPDTRRETLELLADDLPLCQALLEYRKWEKRTGVWGLSWLEDFISPYTRRVHPSWWQLGADTGRFSCSRPNLQQIPREKDFRAFFTARDGNVILSLDYKAIEMLTAGVVARDQRLIDACATGDPHTATARMVLGAGADISSETRQLAKAVGFGLLFGGGVDGFVTYARNTFGVTIERDEAARVVADYFDYYQGLRALRSRAYSFFRYDKETGTTYRPSLLEVRTLHGMRRLLTGPTCKPTTWLNTQIQGSAGAGIKAAMARVSQANLTQYLCAQIHDELVLEVPENQADEIQEQVQTCMIRGMQDILGGSYPVQVDVARGKVWC